MTTQVKTQESCVSEVSTEVDTGISATSSIVPAAENALAHIDTSVNHALAVANESLNDAVHDHVIVMADNNGSTLAPSIRYTHYANATLKAVTGLPHSNATVVESLPAMERAELAITRQGVAERIPMWAEQAEREGGTKPHNRILKKSKEWAANEIEIIRGCDIADLSVRINTLALPRD